MKKLFNLIIIFSFFITYSQKLPEVPWNNSGNKTDFKTNYQILLQNFEQFKKNHNIHKKGSGVKPFERWRSIWEPYIQRKEGFHPITDIDEAFQKKLNLQKRTPNDNLPDFWTSLGPVNIDRNNNLPGKGRVNFILIDPTDDQKIYLGAPAGGLWKTTNGGQLWIPLTDNLPQIGVSAIALSPTDSNTIYIGTGDDDASNTYSRGVFKSTDGGQTWTPIGPVFSSETEVIREIIVDPVNPNTILVASSDGLYRTTDDGQNWSQSIGESIRTMRMHPTDHNIIYAGSGNQFYRSVDNGASFSIVNINYSGFPSFMEMDVTPAAPQKVYLLVGNNDGSFGGIYVSNDNGQNFSQTQQTANFFSSNYQTWYNFAFAVSDTDPNKLFIGIINIFQSTDGGNTVTQLNSWNSYTPNYTHADTHFLRYYNGKLVAGTDGGIFVSNDDGNTFTDLNSNLVISQLYRISVSHTPNSQIYGGLQDNGGFSRKDNIWRIYHGGDGMDNALEYNNPETGYSFLYYGWGLNITHDGGISVSEGVQVPSGEQGNWITPLEMSADGNLYAGFKKLYKLVDGNWQAVTNNSFAGNIDFIRCNPNNPSEIFVAEGNQLYKSVDSGVSFTNIFSTIYNITSIDINPFNNKIWVTTDNQIFESSDYGTSWIDITGNYPGEHINMIKWHPFSSDNTLYLATDLGVYTRNDMQTDWAVLGDDLPNVPVRDIEVDNENGLLTIATFGRGVWQAQISQTYPDYDLAVTGISTTGNHHINCDLSEQVKVTVKNKGTQYINSFSLNYDINGSTGNINYTGILAPNQSATIDLPAQTWDYQKYTVNVSTQFANDQFLQNNHAQTILLFNKTGNLNFQTSFEDEINDQFLSYRLIGSSLWSIASPSGNILNQTGSGVKAYCTNPTGNYDDKTKEYLVTPCFDFSNAINPTISFKLAYDLEENWDAFYVQYSTDNGDSWNILGNATDNNWYNSDFVQSQCIGSQWTGTNTNMQTYSHDLTFLSGENQVMFRFVLASDDLVTQEGVVLDDLNITGVSGINEEALQKNIAIFPNPAKNLINIRWNNLSVDKIEIYNITGQKIIEKNILNDKNIQINLNHLNKGLYIVKFIAKKHILSKKLLISG